MARVAAFAGITADSVLVHVYRGRGLRLRRHEARGGARDAHRPRTVSRAPRRVHPGARERVYAAAAAAAAAAAGRDSAQLIRHTASVTPRCRLPCPFHPACLHQAAEEDAAKAARGERVKPNHIRAGRAGGWCVRQRQISPALGPPLAHRAPLPFLRHCCRRAALLSAPGPRPLRRRRRKRPRLDTRRVPPRARPAPYGKRQ